MDSYDHSMIIVPEDVPATISLGVISPLDVHYFLPLQFSQVIQIQILFNIPTQVGSRGLTLVPFSKVSNSNLMKEENV